MTIRSISLVVAGAILLAGCGGGETTVRPSVKRGGPAETESEPGKRPAKEAAKPKDGA